MDEHEIPQRELRNDVGRVLRDVAQGARYRVTVRGRPVADLVPVDDRPSFAPRTDVERILADSPLDAGFIRDVESVAGATIDEL